jgi:hypothetical protein
VLLAAEALAVKLEQIQIGIQVAHQILGLFNWKTRRESKQQDGLVSDVPY